MITIRLNGEICELHSEQSLTQLMESLKPANPYFAVAVNRTIIPRSEQGSVIIKSGDEIEMVHPVAGG